MLKRRVIVSVSAEGWVESEKDGWEVSGTKKGAIVKTAPFSNCICCQ